jgi:transcriptional regulator with XRE-family HTH domain
MVYNWNVAIKIVGRAMPNNKPFVEAVRKEQEAMGKNQAEFSRYIGVSEGTLSKFYRRGIKDGMVTKVLAKFPHLAHFFVSEHSN